MELAYCVYLTIYYGNKMPMFYIGSSSIKKVNNGYRGSVSSKVYIKIWKSELKNNPQLFKTKIISRHSSREEATGKECALHKKLNVVKSCLHINRSIATKNGFFGMDVSKEKHPLYKKPRSPESRRKMSENHHDVNGENNPMHGRSAAKENNLKWYTNGIDSIFVKEGTEPNGYTKGRPFKNRKPRKHTRPVIHLEKTCPVCGITGKGGNMTRYHFDNCKYKTEGVNNG